tara:strand:- start:7204 stop:8352 length:1149 start_codon:yes stop_codon:yes gene_type:complete
MSKSKFSEHIPLPPQDLNQSTDLIPVVDVSDNENKVITPNQLGGAITASHVLTADHIINSNPTFRDVGTLDRVVQSGSVTDQPITASAYTGIDSSGTITSNEFKNLDPTGTTNPITSSFSSVTEYGLIYAGPNSTTSNISKQESCTIKICDINTANSVIDGTYDPNASHPRSNFSYKAGVNYYHVIHYQSFHSSETLFSRTPSIPNQRFFRLGILSPGDGFKANVQLFSFVKDTTLPLGGKWEKICQGSKVFPSFSNWDMTSHQSDFIDIGTDFDLIQGKKYWVSITVEPLGPNYDHLQNQTKLLSNKINPNFYTPPTTLPSHLDHLQRFYFGYNNISFDGVYHSLTNTLQHQSFILNNDSPFGVEFILDDRICCEIIDLVA